MKKALVTGGAGFLGSTIVKELLEEGVEVRTMILPGESRDNLDGLRVEIVEGNLLDLEACKSAVAGMDTVFAVAAVFKDYMPDPTLMYQVNLRGTFNLLEAARRSKSTKRVVYTASIVALGRSGEGTLGTEATPYDAWDIDFAYSRSKHYSMLIAQDFANWGLDVRIVCPGVVFGPGDIGPTPSGGLIINTLKGTPPIYTDGGAAYVDVRDAARVHVLAAQKGKAGEIYVAAGHNVSNGDFAPAIERAAGRPVRTYRKIPYFLAKLGVALQERDSIKKGEDPMITSQMFGYAGKSAYFDASKSVQELGATYRPFEETLRDAIEYFRGRGLVQ